MLKSIKHWPIIRSLSAKQMVYGKKNRTPIIPVVRSTTTETPQRGIYYTRVNDDIIVGTSTVGDIGAVRGYKSRVVLPTGKKAKKIVNKALLKNTRLIGKPDEEILEQEMAKKGAFNVIKALLRDRLFNKFNRGENLGFSKYV